MVTKCHCHLLNGLQLLFWEQDVVSDLYGHIGFRLDGVEIKRSLSVPQSSGFNWSMGMIPNWNGVKMDAWKDTDEDVIITHYQSSSWICNKRRAIILFKYAVIIELSIHDSLP